MDLHQLGLAPDGRVLDAGDRLALAQAADATLGGADAHAHVVDPALADLQRHFGIGDQGARHADEVADPRRQRRLGLLGRHHAPGHDDRHAHDRLREGGEVVEDPARVVVRGRDRRLVAQRLRVGAADHPVIGDAERVQPPRDLQQLLAREAALDEMVAAVPQADDEVAAHRVAECAQHLGGQAQAVLEAAAVLVGARVGERRDEVLEQVAAVERDVGAVVAALLEPHGRRRPRVDHLADLGPGHDVGPLAVPFLPRVRGRPQRRAGVPRVAAAAAVRDLRQAERAVTVDRVAHLAELRDDAVVPVVDLAPVVDRRRVDARGAEHHHHAAAALRLLLVVADVALGDVALLAEGGAVRRGDDAVLGRGVAEADRAEQPREGAHHLSRAS